MEVPETEEDHWKTQKKRDPRSKMEKAKDVARLATEELVSHAQDKYAVAIHDKKMAAEMQREAAANKRAKSERHMTKAIAEAKEAEELLRLCPTSGVHLMIIKRESIMQLPPHVHGLTVSKMSATLVPSMPAQIYTPT